MYSHNKAQQSKNRVHISWDILYRGLTGLPASERFSGLFCTCFEISISIWNMVYTQSRKCHTSSHITIRSLWPTYSQKWVTVIFLHIWPQQWYRALGFGTHIYITSVLTRFLFPSLLGHIWPFGGHKHSEGESQQSSPPVKTYWVHGWLEWGSCDPLHVLSLGTVN